MQQVQLLRGAVTRVSVTGPIVRIQQASGSDYVVNVKDPLSPFFANLIGASVVVGFDVDPTSQNHQAIVPPFSEATFAIPSAVSELHLLWPTDDGATITELTELGPTPALMLFIEFLPSVVATGTRLLEHVGDPPAFSGPQANGSRLAPVIDVVAQQIIPAQPEFVLDQGQRVGLYRKHVRPRVAPSATIPMHIVAAANTLFDVTDGTFLSGSNAPPAQNTTRWIALRPWKRLLVSSTVSTLFVLGGPGLTVGSPGLEEAARIILAANTPFVFEFDEGIEQYNLGVGRTAGGNLRAYVAVAATLEMTAILG